MSMEARATLQQYYETLEEGVAHQFMTEADLAKASKKFTLKSIRRRPTPRNPSPPPVQLRSPHELQSSQSPQSQRSRSGRDSANADSFRVARPKPVQPSATSPARSTGRTGPDPAKKGAIAGSPSSPKVQKQSQARKVAKPDDANVDARSVDEMTEVPVDAADRRESDGEEGEGDDSEGMVATYEEDSDDFEADNESQGDEEGGTLVLAQFSPSKPAQSPESSSSPRSQSEPPASIPPSEPDEATAKPKATRRRRARRPRAANRSTELGKSRTLSRHHRTHSTADSTGLNRTESQASVGSVPFSPVRRSSKEKRRRDEMAARARVRGAGMVIERGNVCYGLSVMVCRYVQSCG